MGFEFKTEENNIGALMKSKQRKAIEEIIGEVEDDDEWLSKSRHVVESFEKAFEHEEFSTGEENVLNLLLGLNLNCCWLRAHSKLRRTKFNPSKLLKAPEHRCIGSRRISLRNDGLSRDWDVEVDDWKKEEVTSKVKIMNLFYGMTVFLESDEQLKDCIHQLRGVTENSTLLHQDTMPSL